MISDVSDWLKIFGIELKTMLGSEYKSQTLDQPSPAISVSGLAPSEVVSGLLCQYKASVKHLQDLTFFSRSHIQRRVGAWRGAPISQESYAFGEGVLVSDVEGRALVTFVPVVDDGSSVIGDVLKTVLNNSIVLDVTSTDRNKDTFYFIKDSQRKVGEDMQHLGRLTGKFNVTNGKTKFRMETRVSTPTSNIVIIYGEKPERVRNKILQMLEEQAETSAWAREAALVSKGRPGSRAWEASEIVDLTKNGRVPGFVATHVHSSSRYPLLAADASNIIFKHESSRKRRKSRRKGRGRKNWRRRGGKGDRTIDT